MVLTVHEELLASITRIILRQALRLLNERWDRILFSGSRHEHFVLSISSSLWTIFLKLQLCLLSHFIHVVLLFFLRGSTYSLRQHNPARNSYSWRWWRTIINFLDQVQVIQCNRWYQLRIGQVDSRHGRFWNCHITSLRCIKLRGIDQVWYVVALVLARLCCRKSYRLHRSLCCYFKGALCHRLTWWNLFFVAYVLLL